MRLSDPWTEYDVLGVDVGYQREVIGRDVVLLWHSEWCLARFIDHE